MEKRALKEWKVEKYEVDDPTDEDGAAKWEYVMR
jgi:hypothetical protein